MEGFYQCDGLSAVGRLDAFIRATGSIHVRKTILQIILFFDSTCPVSSALARMYRGNALPYDNSIISSFLMGIGSIPGPFDKAQDKDFVKAQDSYSLGLADVEIPQR
jgi:hypothetical protein